MGCKFPEHHGGGSSGGMGMAEALVLVALILVGAEVLMWVLHVLMVVATGVGFVTLAAGGAYGTCRYRRYKSRRLAGRPWAPRGGPVPGRVVDEVPAGDVHLHLPPGMTAQDVADVAEIMRWRSR